MKTPLFTGGLERYTAWFFKVRNIVLNEQRLIEWEEQEKARAKSEKKSKKGGTKPKVGGRQRSGRKR